jgi:hypothetical protein
MGPPLPSQQSLPCQSPGFVSQRVLLLEQRPSPAEHRPCHQDSPLRLCLPWQQAAPPTLPSEAGEACSCEPGPCMADLLASLDSLSKDIAAIGAVCPDSPVQVIGHSIVTNTPLVEFDLVPALPGFHFDDGAKDFIEGVTQSADGPAWVGAVAPPPFNPGIPASLPPTSEVAQQAAAEGSSEEVSSLQALLEQARTLDRVRTEFFEAKITGLYLAIEQLKCSGPPVSASTMPPLEQLGSATDTLEAGLDDFSEIDFDYTSICLSMLPYLPPDRAGHCGISQEEAIEAIRCGAYPVPCGLESAASDIGIGCGSHLPAGQGDGATSEGCCSEKVSTVGKGFVLEGFPADADGADGFDNEVFAHFPEDDYSLVKPRKKKKKKPAVPSSPSAVPSCFGPTPAQASREGKSSGKSKGKGKTKATRLPEEPLATSRQVEEGPEDEKKQRKQWQQGREQRLARRPLQCQTASRRLGSACACLRHACCRRGLLRFV